jgi:hypothetical protein
MDMSLLTGALSSLKVASDMAGALIGIRDEQKLQAAVIELQSKIVGAQSAAVAAQSQQMDLLEQIRALKTALDQAHAWKEEAGRYELVDFGSNTFAYQLKGKSADGEPMHRICSNCFTTQKKSILQFQFKSSDGRDKYQCPLCKNEFFFGVSDNSAWNRRRSKPEYF